MTPTPDVGFDLNKEGRVRWTCEYHAACAVVDVINWVRDDVVK